MDDKPTPEEIAAARAMVAAADAEEAERQRAEAEAHYAPLRAFVSSAAFAEVRAAARALAPQFRDDETVYVHLSPLADFMVRLTTIAGPAD